MEIEILKFCPPREGRGGKAHPASKLSGVGKAHPGETGGDELS